jgi:hypothetical protein
MDDDTRAAFAQQDAQLQEIYTSVEKTRKYFLWTLIATALFFILPLIAALFIIPAFISTLSSMYGI